MNETLQQVLADIESMKSSLEIVSSQGIPIIDTFANISTWVDLGVTLLATIGGAVIGGYITILLFRKQEKMRIKADLRLEFYKEYEYKYKDVPILVDEFERNIVGVIECFHSIGVNRKVHMFEKINTQADIIKNYESEEVQKAIVTTNKLFVAMKALEIFMKSKELIHGYNEFKFKEEFEVLRSIKNKFEYLKDKRIRADKFNYIHSNGGNMETEHFYGERSSYKVENIEELCNTNIEEYKIAYRELIEICKTDDTDEIKICIQNNNKEIQNEFIGKYFLL